MRTILLIERNQHERESLAVTLRKKIDCVVLEARSSQEALDILSEEDVSVVLGDFSLTHKNGFEFLKAVIEKNAGLTIIPAIPLGDREVILEVLRMGAFFYINTPYMLDEVVITAARGLRVHEINRYHESRGHKIRKADGFHGIIGQSQGMKRLFNFMEKVAQDDASTVLIQGESGTGKELVARAIQAYGPRSGKNFVPVNCAAIPDELLESELFGYIKGAFTGATQSKMGRIQYADGGTLFLDEIGDMKPALQAKLLRVLQEKEFEPVGGVKPVPVDVRVIAATHCDLEKAVAEGRFREDLYYRLSVVPLTIPPLRERKDDIPLLIEKFIQVFNRDKPEPIQGFADETVLALMDYPWPGNVRELENLIQRLTILQGGELIQVSHLPSKYRAHLPGVQPPSIPSLAEPKEIWCEEGVNFNDLISEFEDQLISKALVATKGNKKEAARLLNLKRTTLLEKIKKKGIQDPQEGKMVG